MYSDILLTVDFDRTLTAPDSTIPQSNLDAIREFLAGGGAFTINTGRSVPMSRRLMEIVPLNAPLLLYNGSGWYDVAAGKLVWGEAFALDVRELAEQLLRRFPELTLEVQGVQHHYLFRKNQVWESYCTQNGASWAYTTPQTMEQPLLKLALYSAFENATVASMYRIVPEELALLEAATQYLSSAYGDKLELFRACPRILDIHAKGCSKLRSARQLQKALGKKLLVCVGDGENDVNMLEGADYGFCPGDGIVADRFPNVCACDRGAVAEVIRQKLPALLSGR